MKKSMIAAAVVATAFAATANATFFSIIDAGTGGNGELGDFTLQTNTVANIMTGGGTDITAAGSGVRALDGTAVNDIVAVVNGALGAVGGTPRLTYFAMNNGSSEGYFAVVFQNNGTARDWTVNIGQASAASKGVFTNDVNGFIAGDAFNSLYGVGAPFNTPQLAANGVYVAIFAGMGVGAQIGGSNLSDSSFDVHYLNFSAGNYGSFVSAAGAANSNINAATYSIPVPAPALLAGAGLVGAAALRRRMAKKA